jgi:catechol 2,3-dioxygenase-like lactoylglutathione lyase family enzyme
MQINKLDHLVVTVTDIEETLGFYTRVLDMESITFTDGRKALRFGEQKINLHKAGTEIEPHAQAPMPGSTDICFITDTPMQQVINHLASCNVAIIEGPVKRNGTAGSLLSIYIRDPDGNLIELANLLDG